MNPGVPRAFAIGEGPFAANRIPRRGGALLASPPMPEAASVALVRVGDSTDILGESPLWDERAQCLWWVDIRRPALRRWVPALRGD